MFLPGSIAFVSCRCAWIWPWHLRPLSKRILYAAHFTKGLWVPDWNIVGFFILLFTVMIQSRHNLAHAETAQLSWYVRNPDLIWPLLFIQPCGTHLQHFDFTRSGARCEIYLKAHCAIDFVVYCGSEIDIFTATLFMSITYNHIFLLRPQKHCCREFCSILLGLLLWIWMKILNSWKFHFERKIVRKRDLGTKLWQFCQFAAIQPNELQIHCKSCPIIYTCCQLN